MGIGSPFTFFLHSFIHSTYVVSYLFHFTFAIKAFLYCFAAFRIKMIYFSEALTSHDFITVSLCQKTEGIFLVFHRTTQKTPTKLWLLQMSSLWFAGNYFVLNFEIFPVLTQLQKLYSLSPKEMFLCWDFSLSNEVKILLIYSAFFFLLLPTLLE